MKADIIYLPNFINNPDNSFRILREELEWVRTEKLPRAEYYINDFPEPYTYGGPQYPRTYQPQAMHPEVMRIRTKLQNYCGCKFEVCFLNLYENQRHQLGWHADNSDEMDDERPIVSISLGAVRKIQTREIGNGSNIIGVDTYELGNGSAFIMQPGMQDTHQHRIPKADRVVGERISLTFRGYVKTEK